MKKITIVFITIAMLLSTLPIAVYSANIVESGTCGDNLTWTLDDIGTLTISGEGEMYGCDAFFRSCFESLNLTSKIKKVIISKGVTSIGEYAFNHCANLTSVSIPNSVNNIGDVAFKGCIGLTSISIPNSVKHIGAAAFAGCTNLTSVSMPEGVNSIDYNAFYGCSGLTSVFIGNDTTNIGCAAFQSCVNLTDVYISNSVERVEYAAFYDCIKLKNVYYLGTEEQWNKIDIDDMAFLDRATIHFNYKLNSEETAESNIGNDESENEEKQEAQLNENQGLADFTIVNAATKEPIEGVSVIVAVNDDEDVTVITDAEGKCSAVLPIGKLTASICKNGYLARNIKITIKQGKQQIPLIGISEKPLVETEVKVTEMTKDEIIKAGISTTAVSNQHVYKYEAKFSFRAGIDVFSIITYFLDGKIILPTMPSPIGGGEGSGGGKSASYFHSKPLSGGGSCVAGPSSPAAIRLSDGTDVTIYPVGENFYLIIYGEVKWIKEMFDVEMLVVNNSLTDTIENCVATLELPEGLSLATMNKGSQSVIQKIERIGEGESDSVHWYVRGDKEGTYDITAKLDGFLMPFEEEFHYSYKAQSPIKVYAGSAMHMTFVAPEAAFYGEDYPIRIELENVSHKPIYGLSHTILGFTQGQVTYYSDGTSKKVTHIDKGMMGRITSDEFLPGDKMVIEITSNIMFESEMMNYFKEQLKDFVDDVEGLLSIFEGYKKGAEKINALTSLGDKVNKGIKSALKDSYFSDYDKKEAVKKLSDATTKFLQKIKKSGTAKAVKMISDLENSDFYEDFVKMSELDTITDENVDTKAMMQFIDEMEVITSSSKSTEEFNVYDAVKTMIDLLPIRFYLQNLVVTTLEGSTTEIPYSLKTTPVGARYFGCDNVAKLLYNTAIASIGKVDVPFLIQWMPGVKEDITGYDEAVKYVNSTLEEMTRISVKTATGDTKFKAWIETNGKKTDNSQFLLSSDAQNSTYSNGELSFDGAGIIEVIPHTETDATLYIEDDDGNRCTYIVKVYPEHECKSDIWVNETLPGEGMPAIKAKYCDTCRELIAFDEIDVCQSHIFGEFTPEVIPTRESLGLIRRTCSVCGATESKMVDSNSEYIKKLTFSDVSESDWFYTAVKFAFLKGITNGVSESLFAPNDKVTRGQFITMLCRAYEIPERSGDNFSDAGNTWYTGYLAVAKQLGISNGVGNNNFAPDKEITREEMVMLMYNYWKSINRVDNSTNSLGFADNDIISDWAKKGIAYMNSKGYINGKDNNLFDPKGSATRAEIVQLMCNILQ